MSGWKILNRWIFGPSIVIVRSQSVSEDLKFPVEFARQVSLLFNERKMDETIPMRREMSDVAAFWPLTQKDLLHWWNHQQRKLLDSEYAAILNDLKETIMTMTECRQILGLEFHLE